MRAVTSPHGPYALDMSSSREPARGGPPTDRPWSAALDPLDRFAEVVYGLIIALSVTGSLSVGTGENRSIRLLLSGVLGANIAWGIVDAVMYVAGNVLRRARARATERAIRGATDAEHGRRILAEELPPEVVAVLTESELEAARRRITESDPLAPARFARKDLRGAGAVFLMVVSSTLPVALPFVFMSDAKLALRVSHVVANLLLFLGGCALGRYAGLGPIRTGLRTMSIGIVLVALTIVLGG